MSLTENTGSLDSPESKKAAIILHRKLAKQQAAKAKEPLALQRPLNAAPEVHVAATATATAQAASPRKIADAAQVSASSTPIVASNNQENGCVDDGYMPHQTENDAANDEESEEEDAFEPAQARNIASNALVISSQQQAESNKENEVQRNVLSPQGQKKRRLIDAQVDARQVHFDSQDGELSNHQASDNDVSEDEGFQQPRLPARSSSTLVTNGRSKRRIHNVQAAKRVRTEEPPRRSVERASSGSRALQERPSQASRSQNYADINNAAKDRLSGRPKPPQKRKPWTAEEIETLMELIEEQGISYAYLKKIDDQNGAILGDRDQVAIKDKARNMKTDFLKYVKLDR